MVENCCHAGFCMYSNAKLLTSQRVDERKLTMSSAASNVIKVWGAMLPSCPLCPMRHLLASRQSVGNGQLGMRCSCRENHDLHAHVIG